MNLLITTSTFPLRPDDGRPRFVLDLAAALAEHVNVIVLAPGAAEAPPIEQVGDVEIRRFTYFIPPRHQRLAYTSAMRDAIRGSWLAKIQVPTYLVVQMMRIVELVKQKRIDVLNSHWLIPQGLSGAVARQFCPGIRHVVHAHAGDVYLLSRLRAGRPLARMIVSHSDAVVASGSHVRATLDSVLGRTSGAILQPMGADAGVFAPQPPAADVPRAAIESGFPEGYLLFTGRLVEKKGLAYLLRALPRVFASRPGLGLVVIGSGPLEADLKSEAAQLGIERSVRFVGAQSQACIARYLHGCAAAVVPSIIDSRGETEGMPTVVLEAMAAGTRVIGSAVDGIPDLIRHAHNGWLCRPADPADLAHMILLALASPQQGATIIAEARKTAAAYDWPVVARCYLDILRGSSRL